MPNRSADKHRNLCFVHQCRGSVKASPRRCHRQFSRDCLAPCRWDRSGTLHISSRAHHSNLAKVCASVAFVGALPRGTGFNRQSDATSLSHCQPQLHTRSVLVDYSTASRGQRLPQALVHGACAVMCPPAAASLTSSRDSKSWPRHTKSCSCGSEAYARPCRQRQR